MLTYQAMQANNDTAIREAIARRKAGENFYTIEECMDDMRDAIKKENSHAPEPVIPRP